jgi:hypothetical protein
MTSGILNLSTTAASRRCSQFRDRSVWVPEFSVPQLPAGPVDRIESHSAQRLLAVVETWRVADDGRGHMRGGWVNTKKDSLLPSVVRFHRGHRELPIVEISRVA